jgi:geranylgeranyl diphosphate synthase type II
MNTNTSISQYLDAVIGELDHAFAHAIPHSWPVEETLLQSVRYSLFAGGKRIRPAMLFATLDAFERPWSIGTPAAVAIEMIHTYSLIHDDLPAMDNDDLRRGKPTNHIVFGEAMAILAGDGLLTHAFYMMTELSQHSIIAKSAIIQAIAELSRFAGLNGMVSGQAADMKGEQGQTTIDQLHAIHRDKTGALIACSLKIGGLIAGANNDQLTALEQFGFKLGLAFQIQDDVLDLTGSTEKLGKPLQSDEKEAKVTYPYLLGIDHSIAEVNRLTEEAKDLITSCDIPNPQRLLEIAEYLLRRDH